MIRYSIEPKTRKYVKKKKKKGFLSLGAAKNSSKNISHKTAQATGELTGKETAKKL